MIISPSLSETKRTYLLKYYNHISCDLLLLLFNKFNNIFQKPSPLNQHQNKSHFYNKQCKILLSLPFEVPTNSETIAKYNEIGGIISNIFFINGKTFFKHKRISNIKHIALYVFCLVLFYSVPDSFATSLETEDEVCAICNEPMLHSEKTYVLPCNHRMHAECLCNLVQFGSTNIHMNGLQCPYCKTNTIPLYMNYITKLTSIKNYKLVTSPEDDEHTTFTKEEKIYNGAVLRVLKLVCDYY